jgi:gamma-glutamylcyclotransferase (GGCT)/AIG2-like uncharacterized protein YtfP
VSKRLFVYGTLRHGHPNGQRFGLTADRLVEQGAQLHGFRLYDVSWFPGIQPTDDLSSVVVGDVFDVPDELWGALDRYEGAPSLYRRETVTVGNIEAEVYIYNGSINDDQLITSGEWQRHA